MLLSDNPGAFKDAADLVPIPGVDDEDGATMVLWTYNDANPALIDDQGGEDTVEDVLNQCFTAWRTPEAARSACEREVRNIWGEDPEVHLPEEFPWVEEDAGHGLKQWRLEMPDVEDVYLVHAVRVLD